jgi:hypothetical protein
VAFWIPISLHLCYPSAQQLLFCLPLISIAFINEGIWWLMASWFIQSYLFAVSSHGREIKEARPLSSYYIGINLILWILPAWPNYFPQTPPPNTIPLGLGLQHMDLKRDNNIQSIVLPFTDWIISQ